MAKQRTMRHVVEIYRPPVATSLDDRGQLTGGDVLIASQVPCYVEQLQANELVTARQQYAKATHSVEMYADPSVAVNEECYLIFEGRRLDISGVIDPDGNHLKWSMVCGEVKT